MARWVKSPPVAKLLRICRAVVDDTQAKLSGEWTGGSGLKGFVDAGYQYASANSGATATFTLTAPAAGRYAVRVSWGAHENRGSKVPVENQAKRQVGSPGTR